MRTDVLEDRVMLSAILVTNGTDSHVANELSLREAVAEANADAAAGTSDTIGFDPSLSGATIVLTQGDLELSGAGGGTITIDASNVSQPVTISGNSASPVFQVDSGVQAVFQSINIEDGVATNGNGGGIFNSGTLTVNNATLSGNLAPSGGGIENQGTLTLIGDNFVANAALNSGGALDNNSGTAVLNNVFFSANSAPTGADINDNSGVITLEGQSWTNTATITATNSSTLNLYGNWTNTGSIAVDATSTIGLGSPIAVDPTSAEAANYVWSNSGTVSIADGATVFLGGVFTTDAFNSNFGSFGVTADLSQDTVYLSGTMDNSAADNPVSGGVLALGNSTGSLYLAGGEIYEGAVTTAGGTEFAATSLGGTLDAVTLDGTLDMSAGSASVTILGGLTLNADLSVSGQDAGLSFDDTNPQSVAGNGTIYLTGPSVLLDNQSSQTLTFDPTIGIAVASQGSSEAASISGNWLNEGVIALTGGALNLYGNWTNEGTISVDATSAIGLGSVIAVDPTSAAAADYTWTNTGTIAISDGATVYLGGVFTTNAFNANLGALGVSADLSQDTVYLSGTMNNSAADNPSSGGVLALSASTGPLYLAGGEIYQGSITSSGDELIATSSGGTLDGVTLDSALDMTQFAGVTVTVVDGMTLNGTIELGGTSGSSNTANLYFGNVDDNTRQTIGGTGTIQFGQNNSADDLENNSNSALTFGPDLTIQGGLNSNILGNGPIDVLGSIDDTLGGGQLIISAPDWTNQGAITVNDGAGLTLEGEAWVNNGTIVATGATLILNGNWTNTGSISVDSASTLGLGSAIGVDPTSAAAADYGWTNSGTFSIANGATVYLGGVFTSDEFNSSFATVGVSVDLSQDTVFLSGTMDNSAADNPVGSGVLALTSSSGPLYLAGGEIYQGTITSSGSDDLIATGSGVT
ncbi:MAG TPA: hypothetical protein VEI07_16590, partial [Planctomycetaceae bacterium]|nr:hypothetical protein [Planctomycetaceae bacterium]